MKITYIYLNDLTEKRANINQTLNMVSALADQADVYFFSSWVVMPKIKEVIDFFGAKFNFHLIRLPIILLTNNFFVEQITRALYSILVITYLRLYPSDIIYTRDFGFIYFLSLLPSWLRPKQKIIFEMHVIYHLTSKKVTKNIENKALKCVDYFIPISKGIQEDLENIFHINPRQITVLADGVNLSYYQKIMGSRRELQKKYQDIKPTDKILIYTGTFLDWKGVDTLILSAKYWRDNIKLLLIGGTDPEKTNMINLIHQENVGQKMSVENFLPVKDVIFLLKSADIAIIPNKKVQIGEKYTSPLKLFEYLACKLPIVSSDLPSMREILTENNAVFFEPDNPKDLAEKINFLAQNDDICHKFSSVNYNLVSQYDWQVRAKKIIQIINNIYSHET